MSIHIIENPAEIKFDQLADRPLWVVWRVSRGGKSTKIPYSPITGRMAKADDPSTWGTAAQALKTWVQSKDLAEPYAGVGLELADLATGLPAKHQGLARLGGIDFDGCIPKSDEMLDWASTMVDWLDSYHEVSPSGTGCKLFFTYKAADLPALREAMGTQWSRLWKRPKPADGSKAQAIKLHLGNWYFTWTNRRFSDAPEVITPVHVDDLLKIIREFGPPSPTSLLHRR